MLTLSAWSLWPSFGAKALFDISIEIMDMALLSFFCSSQQSGKVLETSGLLRNVDITLRQFCVSTIGFHVGRNTNINHHQALSVKNGP